VLELLGSGNIEFNILDVARVSGVHRATIHRRWPDRKILIRNALSAHQSVIDVEYTGNFPEDIRRLAFAFRDFFITPREIALIVVLASSKNLEFVKEFVSVWLKLLEKEMDLITRAQSAGEITANLDPDIVLSMLATPIMAEVLFSRIVPTDQYLEKLVAHVVQLCVPSRTSEAFTRVPAKKRSAAK